MAHEITADIYRGGNYYNAVIEYEYTPAYEGNGPGNFYGPTPDEPAEINITSVKVELDGLGWATLDDEYVDFAVEVVEQHIEDEATEALIP